MPIDIEHEELIPIRKAPAHIPGRPHISCVYRWLKRSNRPLETALVGGRRFTSIEAIRRFIAGCNTTGSVTDTTLGAKRKMQMAMADTILRKANIRRADPADQTRNKERPG